MNRQQRRRVAAHYAAVGLKPFRSKITVRAEDPSAPPTECELVFDGVDMFFAIDGQHMAKRGHPETPQARQWIPLVPGFEMHDNLYGRILDDS
jgi:hypothetical protein